MEKTKFVNKEVKEFFRLEVANLAENTQKSKMFAITKFLKIIDKSKAKTIKKEDILKYIESDYFTNLSNSSKNLMVTHIGTFLKYYERKDLLDLFPDYNEKQKELDKNELINRDDLEMILDTIKNTEHKTMVMVLYESAVRKGELLGIKKKNLQFNDEYCNLYIDTSKTTKRNIPLVESIPYLKVYLEKNDFEKEDRLFDYSNPYVNILLNRIEAKTKEKYDTFNKDLNPHLFRHSRLTELASNRKLNEPQLRKFAGWSKNSNMPAIYFHLDDSSIRNEIINQSKQNEPKKTKESKELKRIRFETIKCSNCAKTNNKSNEFCWNCGKVINKDLVVKKIKEKERIKQLEKRLEKVEKILKKFNEL